MSAPTIIPRVAMRSGEALAQMANPCLIVNGDPARHDLDFVTSAMVDDLNLVLISL